MSKYKKSSYLDFLNAHIVPKNSDIVCTNTRIIGGKYHISQEEYATFLSLYHRDIVSKGGDEYLTEKQLYENGPIAIDCDFRYTYETTEKQYTMEHINTLILSYLNKLKSMLQFTASEPFPVYVFEKPNVNRLEEKKLTKDGVHIIIGIQSDRILQIMLREKIVEEMKEEWKDLPLINTMEDVFDKGISDGTTNWQLYGSCKPNHEKYALTHAYEYEFDDSDGEFIETKINLKKFSWTNDFPKLSVRYDKHPYFFHKVDFENEYREFKENTKAPGSRSKIKITRSRDQLFTDINTKEGLEKNYENFLESLKTNEYEMREIAEYVMILPESFYGNGSYDKWIRVGWALANMNKKMLIVWLMFSSKAPTFQYSSITELYESWSKFDINNGYTKRSIIYWAKESNPIEYKKIRENSIDYYLNQSIKSITLQNIGKHEKNIGCGDADIAKILFMMYNDEFACASLKADKWYRFSKHRWVEDESGTSLRRRVSDQLRNLYRQKCDEFSQKLCDKHQTEENLKKYETLANKVLEVIVKLGQTTHKDHILKEARELFYDPEMKFLDLLDSNPYLMCFNNGVLDIKAGEFRAGRADDYLEKCTNIDYIELDDKKHGKQIAEINDFMAKLFPIEALRNYMWEHLASLLLGVNLNQKLHIYIGGGENGKSVLTDLLSHCFGDYYAITPISLITQARQKQGQASPDIVALKGLRFAVMQEPSKDDKINDGAMKELTSGVEPIKGRNLFSTSVTFVPQMKIAVCSNNFPKISTQDHGTWRRIAVVDFMSLFTDKPQDDDVDKPFQFKKDVTLKEKFPEWKEVFMSLLVKIVLRTKGEVNPCNLVDKASMLYREREDHIAEFIREKIIKDPKGRIKKSEVSSEFNIWYMGTYGRGGPTAKEVHEYLDKKLVKYNTKESAWVGYKIKYDRDFDTDSDDDEIDEIGEDEL